MVGMTRGTFYCGACNRILSPLVDAGSATTCSHCGEALEVPAFRNGKLQLQVSDGREVVLQEDGRWELQLRSPQSDSSDANASEPAQGVVSSNSSVGEAGDLGDTESVIQAKAQAEWPTDFEMQEYEIGNQREAVRALSLGPPQGVTPAVFELIRTRAAAEWPDDFEMRLHEEQEQVVAWLQLADAEADAEGAVVTVIANARAEWPGDYVMQLHSYRENLSAAQRLGRL